MAKKNWYDTIGDIMPADKNYFNFWPALRMAEALNRHPKFDSDTKLGPNSMINRVGATPLADLMADLEGIGFQDKKDHYELVTEIGGNGDLKEDAVKIELLHDDTLSIEDIEDTTRVKVTYEHTVSTEHSHYSHSQTTCVTLPEDADEATVAAHFDEKNRVVVTVDKKAKPKKNHCRTIPIKGI